MEAARHQVTPRQRQLPTAHGERAEVEIDAQHPLDGVMEIAEGAHIMRQRLVAVPGLHLGLCDGGIDDDILLPASARTKRSISPIASRGS